MPAPHNPPASLDLPNDTRPLPFMCRSVHGFMMFCRSISLTRLEALDVSGYPDLYLDAWKRELIWKKERPHQQDGGGIER